MAMEDKDIIQLFFDRNEQAIEETSMKHGNYCNSIAMNILKNRADAEECVADTYQKCWNSIPPNRPSVLRIFLGKITRNLSFNMYKRMNADKRGSGQLALILDELAEVISDENSVDNNIENKELLKEINIFLNGLSRQKRIMFVRRYWYSDSVTDIAKRLGISENNVSVNLNRIRKRLRRYLYERGFEV